MFLIFGGALLGPTGQAVSPGRLKAAAEQSKQEGPLLCFNRWLATIGLSRSRRTHRNRPMRYSCVVVAAFFIGGGILYVGGTPTVPLK